LTKRLYKNKKILFPLIAIAIIVTGVALYVKFNQKSADSPTQQELREQEKEAGPADPKATNEATQRQRAAEGNTSKNSAEPLKQSVVVYISSAGQSGGDIFVNAIVENQTSGNCTLTLTKAGSPTVTRAAQLGLVTSYYACQGFTIERGAFAQPGDWTAVVSFSNNQSEGKSKEQKVTVQ